MRFACPVRPVDRDATDGRAMMSSVLALAAADNQGMGDVEHGKFCVCDGVKNDLCNEDFFRGGSSAVSHTISLLTLIFALASIH